MKCNAFFIKLFHYETISRPLHIDILHSNRIMTGDVSCVMTWRCLGLAGVAVMLSLYMYLEYFNAVTPVSAPLPTLGTWATYPSYPPRPPGHILDDLGSMAPGPAFMSTSPFKCNYSCFMDSAERIASLLLAHGRSTMLKPLVVPWIPMKSLEGRG